MYHLLNSKSSMIKIHNITRITIQQKINKINNI